MTRRTAFQSAALIPAMLDATAHAATLPPDTVYELRIYHIYPGKLPLILDRFRTKEVAIFERLGMHKVAFFTPTHDEANTEAQDTLIYLMRHNSREAARESWAKFQTDPEWLALKAETEKDGPFNSKPESTFIKLTDFSPVV